MDLVKGDNSFTRQAFTVHLPWPLQPTNLDPRENASSWSDASGNFWIMGGIGYAVTAGGLYGASEGQTIPE